MAYTLLKNDRIVTGPRDWNARYFEYFLQEECGENATLPDSPIIEPLVFNENVKLVITSQEALPNVNPMFEVLAGPNFKYDDAGNHVSYYVAQELPLEIVKNNLISAIADARWNKEITPIKRIVGDSYVTIYTDRESRTSYTQALILAGDDYSAQWKFPEGFINLNKDNLQYIVNEVATYVQSCFDWEAIKNLEVNSKTTVEELKQIIVE